MNKKVVLVFGTLVLLALLFPPYKFGSNANFVGFGFIFTGPSFLNARGGSPDIAVIILIIEIVVLVLLGWLINFAIGKSSDPKGRP